MAFDVTRCLDDGGTTIASKQATISADCAVGQAVILTTTGSSTQPTITDLRSNSWTLIDVNVSHWIFMSVITTALLTTDSAWIKADYGSSQSRLTMLGVVTSGFVGTPTVDVHGNGGGTLGTTALPTLSLTTTQAAVLLYEGLSNTTGGAPPATLTTPATGFTKVGDGTAQGAGPAQRICDQKKVVAATSTYDFGTGGVWSTTASNTRGVALAIYDGTPSTPPFRPPATRLQAVNASSVW